MIETDVVVLRFTGRPVPRALAALASRDVGGGPEIDAATAGTRRVVVLGTDSDLAAVLTRLMRTDRLDVEVAHVPDGPLRPLHARRAVKDAARRVPLVRDDTGTALVGSALWLPPEGADRLHGEAVVDDTVLFDGAVSAVRIEPTAAMPGLRAAVLAGPRRRWVSGRAAQLGTTGVRVVRDGVPGARELKRSTFYRHTTGWLRVG
ncbi:peptidase M50 [Mycolicibacterium sp.]|uniref:peptidase M50 n=1 Tax=Mycolicibacterium sp. TaxID=2320850 RepID=UPI001D6D9E93|nr:peptidase M50 [Mycolicibacterium sp.]MCB1286305.1 peptidase M50 [Mycobacterium sp.]MCB9410635.1 peptidase M50 [Mycolicibacterium sp.]